MSTTKTPPTAFEPVFVQMLTKMFEEKIVFNSVLGLKITAILPERVSGRIAMRHELIGHYGHNRIHGGAISACLDVMGGLAVVAAIAARHMDEPPEQRIMRFTKLGTIDLRIDFLRQGIGSHFDMHGEVLRLGSRVASTRMEFRGPDCTLMATGAAAYIVS